MTFFIVVSPKSSGSAHDRAMRRIAPFECGCSADQSWRRGGGSGGSRCVESRWPGGAGVRVSSGNKSAGGALICGGETTAKQPIALHAAGLSEGNGSDE